MGTYTVNALHSSLVGYQAMLSTWYNTTYKVCLALSDDKWTVGPSGEGEVWTGKPTKGDCLLNADKIDRYNALVSGLTAFNLMSMPPYDMGIYQTDQSVPLVFAQSLLLLDHPQFFSKGKIVDALVVATQTRDKIAAMTFDLTAPKPPLSESQIQANALVAPIVSMIAARKQSTVKTVILWGSLGLAGYAAYKLIAKE